MSCHTCGKSGHLAQNCFKWGAPKNPSQLRCDHFKKLGHTKERCWNLKKAANTVVLGNCNGQSNPSIQEGRGNYLQVSAAYIRGYDVTGMPVPQIQDNSNHPKDTR
ncbi:hypothetical protein RRG08_065257 [Elysia crispata]|uniref:CCHC-type domain-containing protein n=1 Tax=Elysia crispata TaxID=231223 RepID=A0AAE1DLK3_9GAST|nr:hypothetical protein RRG08_065257 [Elysia crispata]